MKMTESLKKLILSIIALVPVIIFTSCDNKRDSRGLRQEFENIGDTLHAGNLAGAIRITEELKGKALSKGDTALWSEIMVQQGINSYYQGNPERLLASADSAIKWLERQHPDRERARVLAKAYQTYGAYYDQYYFNPDSASYYLRKSVDNVEISGIRTDLPQAYGNYANALRMASKLDSAAIYYHRAISITDSLGLDAEHYTPLYNGIAAVFADMKDFDNSKIWWEKSLSILESMNQFDKFNTLTGYGNYLYYSENYQKAEQVFTRLRNMLDSLPESRWEKMFTDVNIADIYLNIGRQEDAKALLDSTAAYFSAEQYNPVALSYIHTLQIKSALADDDIGRATGISNAHPESDTLRLEQRLARLKVLEDLYSKSGKYKMAYDSRKLYDQLNDSLRSDNLKNQISTLNARYQRDQRILNLEANNTRQKAHIYLLFAAVALAIAIILGLIFYFVVKRFRVRLREEKMINKIVSLRQENLRNRVTPHFIYNALNHELNNKLKGNPSKLDSLVELIRKQQVVASEMLIPFDEELTFVDDYVRVVSDNTLGVVTYTKSIDPDLDLKFLFPSMTLQILVENAFKHGFTSLQKGEDRHLDISVKSIDGNRIAVSVFNNGTHNQSQRNDGTGLRVLVETIRFINDLHHTNIEFKVNADSELNGKYGYCATITLPTNLKQ